MQASIVIILFVYYQLISKTFMNIRRKIRQNKHCKPITKKHCRVTLLLMNQNFIRR